MVDSERATLIIGREWLEEPTHDSPQIYIDERTKTVYNARSLSRFLQRKYFSAPTTPKGDVPFEAQDVWAQKLALAHSLKRALSHLLTNEIIRAEMMVPEGPRWKKKAREDMHRLNLGKVPGFNPGVALSVEEADSSVQWIDNILNTIDAYAIGKERNVNAVYHSLAERRTATRELQKAAELLMKRQMGIDFSLFGADEH